MIKSWKESCGIMVGTQKIIPYIDNVCMSIIASFEHCMSIPNHTTSMTNLWFFQQIFEKTTDRYLVQTKYPDQSFLHYFQRQELSLLVTEDNDLLKKYNFPPYATCITITMENISRRDHPQAKDFFKQPLKPFDHTLQSHFFEHSQTYTIHTIIHVPNQDWYDSESSEMKHLRQLLGALKPHAFIKIETPWIQK
jgi:primosomal protein N'